MHTAEFTIPYVSREAFLGLDLHTQAATALVELVAFTVAGQRLAVPMEGVQEVIQWREVTRVPLAPAYYRGVINLRGTIIPVLDTARRLGLRPLREPEQLVITQTSRGLVALTIDETRDVLRLPPEAIDRHVESITYSEQRFFQAVCRSAEQLYLVLDMEALL
ncbi:MAG: chemotaxis protein CheW [Bacteroidetes bacterium]|nr:chemotaxis protein CheW [Rhodothermia bacterium]MCS7156078.1 chemotaxis protein CheW [Bacteroidota bacterium]MCX7907766.1 chemotaxis protein CheW [Bacteroidota bacterium]MDW8137895.1 chemotaxis protein CheW [Bacteroidota bacterium]MDW8286254.1 chemotaxis protein CheW [Bacteroidota bacterium]